MKNSIKSILIVGITVLISCGGNSEQKEAVGENVAEAATIDANNAMNDKGIGPITSVMLDANIDDAKVNKGNELYNQMCVACHKTDVDFIGPAQKGVLKRRSPEWVMNMMLNPEEMLEKNETAKTLLKKYNNVPMSDMGLTEEQARAILEYFRTL